MGNPALSFFQALASYDIGGTTLIGMAFSFAVEKVGSTAWGMIKKWSSSNLEYGATYLQELFAAIEASITPFISSKQKEKHRILEEASEMILSGWKKDSGLVPATIQKAISHVSSTEASKEQVAIWYMHFYKKISKSDLYTVFILYQLSDMQRVDSENTRLLKEIHKEMMQTSKKENAESTYPVYLSDRPFDISNHFIGRQNIVGEILDSIYIHRSILLSGIGGLGKTEVAKAAMKVIERTESGISGIHKIVWVNYDNRDIRLSIIKALLGSKQIEDYEAAWSEVCVILDKWREKLLVVIDNIENEYDENLRRLADLPCRVFATGRIESLSSLHPIQLSELSIDDCITLFQKFYTRKDASFSTVKKIISLADKHTITIELLAKVAELEEVSLDVFYDRLVLHGFKLSEEEVAAGHERLSKEAHIINQLSILFSVCNLNSSITDLIVKISVIPSLPFAFSNAQIWFNQKNRKNLSYLVHTGWLTRRKSGNQSVYLMHSVIASAIRAQFIDTLYDRCHQFIVELTHELKYEKDDHGSEKVNLIQFSWSVSDLLNNHLGEEKDGDFLYFLARIYTDIANYPQAVALLKRAIQIYRKNGRTNLYKTCTTYNSLGLTYQDMSLYKYSITQYRKIISLLSCYPFDNGFRASLYNNLGISAMHLHDKKAYRHFSEAYRLAKAAYGDNHSETLKILFHLGNAKANAGDNVDALAIYIDVYEKEKSIFGEGHLRVATSSNMIGSFLFDLGRFIEAEKYLEKAFVVREEKLGIKHPATTDTLNTMGLLYLRKGNQPAAQKCFIIVRDYNLKTHGETHPEVAVAYNNLGLSYFEDEDFDNAFINFEKAIQIYRDFGWIDGEEIVAALNNIGYIFIETGKPQKAIDYFNEALVLIKKSKGKLLDELAHTYNHMAAAYSALNNNEKARYYFEESITQAISYWGGEHISLAPTYNNFALLLEEENKLQQSLDYLKKSQKLLIDAYGIENSNLKIVDEHITRIEATLLSDE